MRCDKCGCTLFSCTCQDGPVSELLDPPEVGATRITPNTLAAAFWHAVENATGEKQETERGSHVG
jgi:hypothetical protein